MSRKTRDSMFKLIQAIKKPKLVREIIKARIPIILRYTRISNSKNKMHGNTHDLEMECFSVCMEDTKQT